MRDLYEEMYCNKLTNVIAEDDKASVESTGQPVKEVDHNSGPQIYLLNILQAECFHQKFSSSLKAFPLLDSIQITQDTLLFKDNYLQTLTVATIPPHSNT